MAKAEFRTRVAAETPLKKNASKMLQFFSLKQVFAPFISIKQSDGTVNLFEVKLRKKNW